MENLVGYGPAKIEYTTDLGVTGDPKMTYLIYVDDIIATGKNIDSFEIIAVHDRKGNPIDVKDLERLEVEVSAENSDFWTELQRVTYSGHFEAYNSLVEKVLNKTK